MAFRKKMIANTKDMRWTIEEPNPKQLMAMQADTLYVGYGGAKGGGKTWFIQHKAVGACLYYPEITILIMRAHYPELEQNHIAPIRKMIKKMGGDAVATYNGTNRVLTFYNGSKIRFGHWSGDESENEYNGLEFDWIFMDEATQFSERAFNFLGGCLRGTNDVPKRFYITCNPGGIGHRWVKRLFIDKQYKTNCKNPEENENPADYTFIFASVEDNQAMLKKSPTYLRTLANMPEDLRDAYRYGNWDAIGGNYFKEFQVGIHTRKAFKIPYHWPRYRSFDYGLDMFAVGWWAVDEDGRFWLYRSIEEKGLIVSEAADKLKNNTLPSETIEVTYAPPDMWARAKDTGRTLADVFLANDVAVVKADNNRIQGHKLMKDAMKMIPLKDPYVIQMYGGAEHAPRALPGFMVFDELDKVINDVRDIQSDDKNPDDCSKEPHEVTHTVDMCRYLVISRNMAAEAQKKADELNGLEDIEDSESYEDFMTGGEATASYMAY